MEIKQYQIVLVNLGPTVGSEIKKTRPCLVISPNEMNRYLRTIFISPMTSSSKSYPSRVAITLNKTKGRIVLDQVRTVDRQRIIKQLGNLKESEIYQVKMIIKELYVD